MKTVVKDRLLRGVVFWLLSSCLLAFVFFSYMFNGAAGSFMDCTGWIYFFLSCFCHSFLLMLVPFLLLYVPFCFVGFKFNIGIFVLSFFYLLVFLLAVINKYVFALYHFHINGFVIDMLTSEGASEIFVFSTAIYLKALLILVLSVLSVVLLARLSLWLSKKIRKIKRFYLSFFLSLILVSFSCQAIHIYASATMKMSVLESSQYLPYYFPISMNSALDSMGIIDKDAITNIRFKDNGNKLSYPIHPLKTKTTVNSPNIVLIVIDSWNFRTLDRQCMPNVSRFKDSSLFFSNHLSSSNGTRGGIFGMLTGLSSYYWKSFEYTALQPLLIDRLKQDGYDIQVYPSSNFNNPPFARMFFSDMKINTTTKGNSAYERDCNITTNFIGDLEKKTDKDRPFFSFVFYDLAHAIALPKEKLTRFQPSWTEADYSKLNNKISPLPFYNLYRNCVSEIDLLVGIVIAGLQKQKLLDNTILIITGDHGQEFNENKKNYWGHAGNYSDYQIKVPLIFYYPGVNKGVCTYRTTHYDIVPTLMSLALGVENPSQDYSMGYNLLSSQDRGWHIVGNDLNYAFVTQDGHIIEKSGGGYVKVYDRHLNLVPNYKLSSKQINDNILNLNRFYK